jgi:SAM-dependent methyltransferase
VIGRAVESLRLRALDAADTVRLHDPLLPPRRMRGYVGDSDFRTTGDEFLELCIELAGLRPDERVLDVGSGIGRMARPLARYLRPPGSYEGFDVVPEGIAWCRRRYEAHPNFRFQLADVRNGLYRPDAGVPAREYTFPFGDATFDFAFATSVFTHLLPAEADRYLGETARVLRPTGRMLATFCVLDAAGRHRSAPGGRLTFAHEHGHYATQTAETPEDAVAYDEGWIRDRLEAHGLELVGPIRLGNWSGLRDPDTRQFQDVVLARPAGASRAS